MSYQVLARKWRPRNFQEVVGQQHVLTALSNGLAQNRVHHAYLFSGTRGVGKTTIARILAKSLNCEQGVTATPCGKCVHCRAIDEGRFVDLLEIDAASRTKVDDTRELLDNVQYKPAQGRYKVYLIDEVHMLSKHSFNALLKTLEEPPEYVKFLLATTDPQKLPITVLSRCLQFHLKTILPEEIEKQLSFILQHEQATFDNSALSVIAKAANGSMRDALSLTDQALAFGSGNIEYQAVLKMLGTIDSSHLYYLLHFIASGNVQKVFQKIEEFVHLGADFAKLHQELAALCHQIALLQIHSKVNVAEKNALQLLSERLTPEEVQLYYQITLQGYKDYAFAPNGKIAFEMTVMRLLAFKPANYITLDESFLESTSTVITEQQAPVAEKPQESVTALPVETAQDITVRAPVQPAASIPEPHVVISNIAAPISPADVEVVIKPSEVIPEVVTPAPVTPADVEPVIKPSSVVPSETPVAPIANKEVTHQEEPVTYSRNMLRSHRLKREQAKKLQATTDNNATEAIVVADKHVAVERSPEKPLTDPRTTPITAPITNKAVAKVTVPPKVNETIIADSEPQYQLPPEESLPPIDSYLQDNFSDFNESDLDRDDFASKPFPSNNLPETPALISNTPITPLAMSQATASPTFFSDEQLDMPAVDIAKYVEDKLTDSWSLLIQQMQLLGLVKLLAKNCVMKKVDQQIVLTLKAEQQHLLNNSQICEQLQDKLKDHFGQQMSMYIEVGEVQGQLTPHESELDIYQQYLNNAKNTIKDDKNIKTWVEDYGAKVYENSIIPL